MNKPKQETKVNAKQIIKPKYKKTNRQLRDEFLASKGYSVPNIIKSNKPKTKQLTPFQNALHAFRKLKKEERITIKPYKNRWDIPHYQFN